MTYIMIFIISFSLIFLLEFLSKKSKLSLSLSLKILAIALFTTHMISLFSADAIDKTFNLLLVDIETPINAPSTWLTGVSMSIFMICLRWVTVLSVTLLILNPFFKLKTIRTITSYFTFIIGILNFVFLKQNILMILGEVDFSHFKAYAFAFEISLIITMSGINLYEHILENGPPKLKAFKDGLIVFLVALIALVPQTFFYNLFGNIGQIPEEYNTAHKVVLIIPVIFMIISFIAMKNKSQESKDFFITFIAYAALFQYFSYPHRGLTGLPLHLCNMAIIIMILSITFRLKGFFYFNYFANVLGALSALIFPSITDDLFANGAMRYAFNHWYVFAWPILAVAFKTFKRPVLKDMYQAIVVFSVYYVLIVFVNAWLNNYASVDYFFVYGNHLTDMFGLTGLQYNNVVSFEYKGLTFVFFWLYQIILYFTFIVLMFMSWYVYDACFQFSDDQQKLHNKRNKMMIDELKLRELLDGRSPSEPINPGGIGMIKIKNFSKRYGNSNKYAVKDFSLEVKMGEVFGFLGHNGAGKSTTIKSLVGIQSITEGEMEICGYSIKTQPLEAKLQIGYVSDTHAVYEKLTGREYVQYVSDLYKVDPKDREERLEVLLEQFNLAYAIDNEIKSYSHGMKQKLVVISALIHEPPVWILDEPLTGLDPTSAYQIKESMKEHAKKGNIVFFSSHVIEVVEKVCDRIAIITHGQLQGIYDMNEIRKNNISLEELYMSKIHTKETNKS